MSHIKFQELIRGYDRPSVLELGTKRSVDESPSIHRNWVPHAGEFVGTDFFDGLDVDVVADVSELSSVFGEERFDAIISCSTFEHIQYPWVAAVEIARTLKTGGLLFVQTHHTFPLHAYPHDYWRFSKEGLETLFGKQVGFEFINSEHGYRASILSNAAGRLHRAASPSYLNSTILVRKVSHPPADFRWKAVSDK